MYSFYYFKLYSYNNRRILLAKLNFCDAIMESNNSFYFNRKLL